MRDKTEVIVALENAKLNLFSLKTKRIDYSVTYPVFYFRNG